MNSNFWPLFSFSFSSVSTWICCIQWWYFQMGRWEGHGNAIQYVTIWSPFKKIYYFDHDFALFIVQFQSFLSFVFTNALPMFKQILTFDLCSLFHFLVFQEAPKFNGDLSTWDVGAVKEMESSTLQSDLPSKRSTILTMFLLFSLFNFRHSL